jgi:hypothetical protein
VARTMLIANASENVDVDVNNTTMTTVITRVLRQALIVLATTATAIPAGAEEQTPVPAAEPPAAAAPAHLAKPLRPVRLAIDGIPDGVQVRVVTRTEDDTEAGRDAATCTQDCELSLPKGSYTLVASRGAEQRAKEVDLTSSQVATVGRWDHAGRTMGTVLGVTGIVVGALGALITGAFLAEPAPPPGGDEDTEAKMTVLWLGILGLAGGTGMAIGGFSMVSSNRAPSLEVDRMPASRPSPPPSAATGLSLGGKF